MDKSFYKNKKILVTGHTGFKGSWLCELLLLLGADVTGYALKPPTNPSVFELCKLENHIESVTGDVRDLEHLNKVVSEKKPELIIHMAAQPIVRESYKNPVYTYDVNVMGTVNVLECVRKTESVRSFLNVTTDKVYKNRELQKPFKEDEELNGFDPYSNSKSCSELVTSSYVNSFFTGDGRSIAISTARAGNVIGGGDFAVDRIIPDCFRAAKKGAVIEVRNPNSIRPYQHVLEPIYVYLTILQKQYEDLSFAGSYNVGPDEEDCLTTESLVNGFVSSWKKYTGRETGWTAMSKGGPHEANFLKLDCSKLKERLGWKPEWNALTAVDKTVSWYVDYINGQNMSDVTEKQISEFLAGK